MSQSLLSSNHSDVPFYMTTDMTGSYSWSIGRRSSSQFTTPSCALCSKPSASLMTTAIVEVTSYHSMVSGYGGYSKSDKSAIKLFDIFWSWKSCVATNFSRSIPLSTFASWNFSKASCTLPKSL